MISIDWEQQLVTPKQQTLSCFASPNCCCSANVSSWYLISFCIVYTVVNYFLLRSAILTLPLDPAPVQVNYNTIFHKVLFFNLWCYINFTTSKNVSHVGCFTTGMAITPTNPTTISRPVGSAVFCQMLCARISNNPPCNGFNYNPNDRTCQLSFGIGQPTM